jgi:hypothetical protein
MKKLTAILNWFLENIQKMFSDRPPPISDAAATVLHEILDNVKQAANKCWEKKLGPEDVYSAHIQREHQCGVHSHTIYERRPFSHSKTVLLSGENRSVMEEIVRFVKFYNQKDGSLCSLEVYLE